MTKMGRPLKEFDWSKLDAILQFKCPLVDAADIMGCSEDTIANRIKDNYDMTFSEYRNKKMAKIRYNIAMKQYEVARNGNVTMLIWLGKQWLGQTDKQEVESTGSIAIKYEEADE